MVFQLANRYPKHIAAFFLALFSTTFYPAYAFTQHESKPPSKNVGKRQFDLDSSPDRNTIAEVSTAQKKFVAITQTKAGANRLPVKRGAIGGPNQPEMASFKSVGAGNMVNLFTGDFSYNIPLLDVGGYPVNIFYDGGVSMEQEASWVGLGWNINPGTVSRNMRGLPDDFNGEDTMTQTQQMKTNTTWGASLGLDLELIGIKRFPGNVGLSLGMSYNNDLGPALELGIKGGTNFRLADKAGAEKVLGLGGGLAANISSRSGLTLSPNFSLSANAHLKNATLSNGVRLGTSYNSRSGIKQLQISEQMSYNYKLEGRPTSIGQSLFATSISFAKPSYIPAIRIPVTNEAWSGHFQLGTAMFGTYGSMEAEVYRQRSEIALADRLQKKPMVGYLYYQKANNNPSAVMDFTRVNDNEVTPNTPILSAPQYTYDVFTIQGEGTGGSIRAYRNDRGFVRDNITRSKDKNLSVGADVGIPGHYGANFNLIKTPSTISGWENGNHLRNMTGFASASGLNENVYFRNPGESSVLATDQFAGVGGTELVRFKLGGTNAAPTLEPVLERFSKENKAVGTTNLLATGPSIERKKRSQVVSFLTAEEASWVGLDTVIRIYDVDSVLNYANNLKFETLPRTEDYRKKHHLSEITVTESDGKRYVYGIPVYNVTQKDFTFSVSQLGDDVDQVATSSSEVNQQPPTEDRDWFLQSTEMPAYAHSFLLTGLLSPDYVDVNGDGVTEDDLGQAVKFNYTRVKKPGGWSDYEWRTPATKSPTLTANFNSGNLTEAKDDKGLLTYGKRESWYLHSIESKTMVALFTVENRKDGKGVAGEMGGLDINDNSQKRLKKIDLYSKADLKKNGLSTAKPIKTVWFTYSYDLCPGAPGNNEAIEKEEGGTANLNAAKGKLTLTGIYFTYNGKTRANKSQYRFFYTDKNGSGNPSYQAAASDRWGTYKPATQNPVISQNPTKTLRNSLYPYATQTKSVADQNAGAWALKSVLLPSGGQLDVQYESDDYAFVQNRRASTMMGIAGLGTTSVLTNSNKLYTTKGFDKLENDYVFIKVQDTCKTNEEVKEKYLKGQDQLAFKLSVNMPKGIEYVPVYGIVEASGFVPDVPIIWVRLKRVNGYSPLTIAVLDFLRERLPGQAFSGYDVSESSGLQQVGELLNGMLVALGSAFQDPIKYLRNENKVQTINLNASFVRLNDPDGYKFGGGHRVRSVALRDNWEPMTKLGDASGQATAVYGQQYDYTTTEIFNGKERTISSGVASYEPSIGGEENPFQTMVQVVDQLPLGPASYGAIEMPVLDAFFPAPVVGYSKVTVRSLQKVTAEQTKKSRSGIGKQVTEFFTAKDFPVYYNHTPLEPASDKQEHQASLLSFFYKFAFDSRAVSQGFLIETNDMHGKMKSQASYAEGDEKTPINFTENFYRNTGSKGLTETFDFVHAAKGGTIEPGTMGVDVELMTDTREFSVKSYSLEIQGQVDWLTIIPPFWLPTIWPVVGNSENTYRAVTTTKVITYHSVLDSVVVIDKGSQVSTKNLVYDSESGVVVVNRTNNEFDKPIYTVTYPAWWAYSGMGLAYKNINAIFDEVDFLDGRLINKPVALSQIESGDELLILKPGNAPTGCGPDYVSPSTVKKIWALDKSKNNGSLTNPNKDLIFIDKSGKIYNRSGVSIKIVRGGKRNMLNASVASVSCMADPRQLGLNDLITKLKVDEQSKVVNASALEYKEKWQADNDVIRRLKEVPQIISNLIKNGDFSEGTTGISSDYIYYTSQHQGGNEGKYNIVTNPKNWNLDFSACTDHTSGSGNMMVVNGKSSRSVVWKQTVSVVPNTNYILRFWATPVHPLNPAYLQMNVNNEWIGQNLQLSANPCAWSSFVRTWYSGSNTTAEIKIENLSTSPDGNDFAIDDIFFGLDECSMAMKEVDDCNGYLEKKINPYTKGLLGNFKKDRDMVFYGARKEKIIASDPQSLITNIGQNGYLDEFKLYWNFNSDNNLIPISSNVPSKWVWNSQLTMVNSRGLELETVDALKVYTSAQYGFNKSLPVAITTNSSYEEMFYAGMEDKSFDESVNSNIVNPCGKKHVDFEASTYGSAHSGKSVFEISANSQQSKNFPVGIIPTYFSLATGQQSAPAVVRGPYGGVFTNFSSSLSFDNPNVTFSTGSATGGVNYVVRPYRKTNPLSMNSPNNYNYYITTLTYVHIKEDRNYVFTARAKSGLQTGNGYYNPDFSSVSLLDATNNFIAPKEVVNQTNDNNGRVKRYTYCLKKGVYQLNLSLYATYNYICDASTCQTTSGNQQYYVEDQYSFIEERWPVTLNDAVVFMQSYSTSQGCTYTTPINGAVEMLNPTFTIKPSKMMLFSAWLKESCQTAPCSTYTKNHVVIQFNAGSTQTLPIKPDGPMIEGWQKVEGVFSAPDGATQMTLNFVNNSGSASYYDDIRIHPFNANMKSYVYDPVSLRLAAELDANNYATFYEYDEEGTLVRTKAETKDGIKTIKETRSFQQREIKQSY